MKEKFLNWGWIDGSELLELAKMAGVEIKKNIRQQIENKLHSTRIIYSNGAAQMMTYGMRHNTLVCVSRVIRQTYLELKTN